MPFVLQLCTRYLAIVLTAVGCFGIGTLFGHPRPLDYYDQTDQTVMLAAIVASFAIFLVGALVAQKIK